MKTIILSITAITGSSIAGFAQGTINLDGSNNSNPSSSATSSGLVWLIDPNNNSNVSIPGGHTPGYDTIDTFYDINVELLYGTTPYNVNTPVVTLLRSSNNFGTGSSALGQVLSATGDITGYGTGQLIDDSGQSYVIPNLAAGSTGYFQLLGWSGDFAGYSAAANWLGFNPQTGQYFEQYTGATPIFSEVLGSLGVEADLENMPALVLSPGLDVNGTLGAFVPEPSSLTMAGIGIGSMLVLGCRKTVGMGWSKLRRR